MERIYGSYKRETIGIYGIAQLNQWASLNKWPEIGPTLQFLVCSSRRCWCFKYKWKTVPQHSSGQCKGRGWEREELCLFQPLHSISLHWKCIILVCNTPANIIKCSKKTALPCLNPSWHLVALPQFSTERDFLSALQVTTQGICF